MYQFLSFKEPVPSCEIYALNFNGGIWEYIYALKTPFELTNENKRELIIYEYISDLYLRETGDVHPESVNLRITTLDEYLGWIDKQRIADVEYRKSWIVENPDAKPNTIELENKSYTHSELLTIGMHYIASVINQSDKSTIFAAV